MGMNLKCILCQFQLKHNLPSSSFQEASHKMSDLISSNPVILSPSSVLTINLMKGVAAAAFDQRHQALLEEGWHGFQLGSHIYQNRRKIGPRKSDSLDFCGVLASGDPGALFALVCGSGARQSCKGGGGCFKSLIAETWRVTHGLHSLEILCLGGNLSRYCAAC